ncbi:MAG: HAMP domain-containing histidine kinase [Kastovskya adunca ATA6-11-RM4]|nr:HAMP domain-containing histidine kinase [Kastovskya adunca ATA6-11-RM4]
MQVKWLLPTLSEVLAHQEQAAANIGVSSENAVIEKNEAVSSQKRELKARVKAQREWSGAIAALEQLLLQELAIAPQGNHGLILSGPVPVFSHQAVLSGFQTGIFTKETFETLALMPFQLSPAPAGKMEQVREVADELPLLKGDPLADEQFCLVFTHSFSFVMAVGEDSQGVSAFRFSFDPQVVEQAWVALRLRLVVTRPQQLCQLEAMVAKSAPRMPDYRTVMEFSRQLLKHLPELPEAEEIPESFDGAVELSSGENKRSPSANPFNHSDRQWQPLAKTDELRLSKVSASGNSTSSDVELLQALTHEVRTPLTTIQTLTKLLLKRRDLAPEVIRRLEIIDRECTEQINRMELIFRAAELEMAAAKPASMSLTSMSLSQILHHSIPHWQKQAERRNLTIDFALPQKMPTVVSNPRMLEQVLTGLMENFTRSLPAGSHIKIEVSPAGEQLKLQLQSQPCAEKAGHTSYTEGDRSPLKSIGQLLMFQPETGCLSLNLNVTKNLFQALGGKLIVRQRPQQGEVMTIFLPLEVSQDDVYGQQEIFLQEC